MEIPTQGLEAVKIQVGQDSVMAPSVADSEEDELEQGPSDTGAEGTQKHLKNLEWWW